MLEAMATGILGGLPEGPTRRGRAALRFAYDKFRRRFRAWTRPWEWLARLPGAVTRKIGRTHRERNKFTPDTAEPLKYRRDLAEFAWHSRTRRSHYQHRSGRDVVVDIEDGGDPKILAELVELERRIIAHGQRIGQVGKIDAPVCFGDNPDTPKTEQHTGFCRILLSHRQYRPGRIPTSMEKIFMKNVIPRHSLARSLATPNCSQLQHGRLRSGLHGFQDDGFVQVCTTTNGTSGNQTFGISTAHPTAK